MAATDPAPAPIPKWYLYLMSAVAVVAAAGLILGVVGTYVNAQQNTARDEATARLLGCFDQFASTTSEVSRAVRVASVRKDRATAARDDALRDEGEAFLATVDHILANKVTPGDVKALRDALAGRAAAARRLDLAQDALDRARKDNPVPPPPSKFCGDADAEPTPGPPHP